MASCDPTGRQLLEEEEPGDQTLQHYCQVAGAVQDSEENDRAVKRRSQQGHGSVLSVAKRGVEDAKPNTPISALTGRAG